MALTSAGQPIRWLKRIGILVLGLTVNELTAYGYDFIVYPYLIVAYGLLLGWLYAVVGSIVLCLGTLWFYNVTEQDWLGLETIKLVRDEPPTGRMRKFFHRIANRGDAWALVLLCLKFDAFVVTIYMRRGSGNYAMSTRDWRIFWVSMVVSNAWWGLIIFGAVAGFKTWLAPFVPTSLINWLGLI